MMKMKMKTVAKAHKIMCDDPLWVGVLIHAETICSLGGPFLERGLTNMEATTRFGTTNWYILLKLLTNDEIGSIFRT